MTPLLSRLRASLDQTPVQPEAQTEIAVQNIIGGIHTLRGVDDLSAELASLKFAAGLLADLIRSEEGRRRRPAPQRYVDNLVDALAARMVREPYLIALAVEGISVWDRDDENPRYLNRLLIECRHRIRTHVGSSMALEELRAAERAIEQMIGALS